ncbi:MAG: hypothetical protein ACE5LU_27810, partial [Anaerolineae bacterium]
MSTRTATPGSSVKRIETWLAWALVVLYVVLETVGLTLQVVTDRPIEPVPGGFPVLAISAVALGVWCVIGAVIVSRHPRNPIGWILCVIPITDGMDNFAFGYAAYAPIAHPGSLPGADIMVVWTAISSSSAFFVVLLILLLLLFPDGRLLSPRWRLVAWLGIGAAAVLAPLAALKPGPLEDLPSFITNPIGVSESAWAILDPLASIVDTLVGLCLLAAAISLIVRLRRARGDERQQVKWFVYTAAFLAIGVLFFFIPETELGRTRTALSIGYALTIATVAGLPIAMAIAIFKYRLYDIDVIINRTLVYGALTGALAVVYFGTVVLLQGLFRALTGQESQLAVVTSTLAIAGLFLPLRRRIQEAIDRRFYRRKYDAEKVLA